MAEISWKRDQPKVVDEAMLQQAIEEQRPQGQAGEIAKKEGIQYGEVLHLQLEYKSKNIWRRFSNAKIIVIIMFLLERQPKHKTQVSYLLDLLL